MSQRFQRITPFLWFDRDAEAAANFYVSVFDDARIVHVARYGKAGAQVSGHAEGAVMTVSFELDGVAFLALNGGPAFPLTPAVSFVVNCRDQREIDRYWAALSEGGDERAQQCGWLRDRFGVSWQVVPVQMSGLMTGDPARAERVMAQVMKMKKLDLGLLQQAAAG